MVDLPAPFGPAMPNICPLWTSKLRLSTALRAPNRFVMLTAFSIATPITVGAGNTTNGFKMIIKI
jgi:hypothetical protein